MARKEAKNISAKKNKAVNVKANKSADKLNYILIENFVNLQKAMTNLAGKFDDLAIQISKLLQLFEISAKSFAEKLATGTPDIEKDREFLDKLNRLLDQNKVIAKGLTLMEEKMRERLYGHSAPQPQQQFSPRPLPRRMPIPASANEGLSGYTESSMEREKRTIEE